MREGSAVQVHGASSTRRRIVRAVLAVLAAVCASGAPSHATAGDPPPPHPLRGAALEAVVQKAAEMRGKDVRAFGAALTSLGDPAAERGVDLEFLVEWSLRETGRALRVLAVEAAQRVDAPGAAAAYLERARKEKDAVRAALAVEALGWVGTKEHVAPLLELMSKHGSEMVTTAAAEALARLGTSRDVDEIVDAGLTHKNSHVTDHTAWAVQDIVQKQKAAVAIYDKIASRKSDPRAIRAAATLALIQDKAADAHKWTSPFAEARKALAAAPADVVVQGNAEYVPKIEAAMKWYKERLPAEYWLLCAAVKRIAVPGEKNETRPNAEMMELEVSLADAVIPANKIAYLVGRQSVVLWRKRIGEPYKGHRGWEPAVFDSYDICVHAKLYDAGPALSRERFVAQILSQRPWGGL